VASKPTAASKPAAKPKTAIADAMANAEAATIGAADFLSVGSAPTNLEEEIVAANVSMPPTLEFLSDVQGTANGSCFSVSVYGEGCFECQSLVPSLQVAGEVFEEPPCHFRFGNMHCPAAYHRIQVVGVRLAALARVRKAKASGDGNRLLKQLSKLELLSLEDKNFVLRDIGLLAG
jgi:hypothetical protein